MNEINWTFSHHEKKGKNEYDIFFAWIKNLLVIKKASTFRTLYGMTAKPLIWLDEKTFKKIVL
jgi:hypothetical protein